MTDQERIALVPGDCVLVTMDEGKDREFMVIHPPWKLAHGRWVIGLAGISGGYALDRVKSILSLTGR